MSYAATSTHITPVILCDSSSTRLWPLSCKSIPKQALSERSCFFRVVDSFDISAKVAPSLNAHSAFASI